MTAVIISRVPTSRRNRFGLLWNGANRRIMKAMVNVAKELGIHTLAEGMETQEQRMFLQEIGCELSQGYLYHRPEPIAAMIYRQKNGQKPRAFETVEEREAMIEKWYREEQA